MVIDVKRVYTWFDNHYRLRKSSQGWWNLDECPYCGGSHKMAVHFKFGIVKCWVCDTRMRVMDFIADVEDLNSYQARVMIYSLKETDQLLDVDTSLRRREGVLRLPNGFRYILDGDTVLGRRARMYLESRGFDLHVLDSIGIGYCDEDHEKESENYFGRIIIPFFREGNLIYYIGRTFLNDFLRYKNPSKDASGVGKADLIFNEDALLVEDRVFIMEGAFDAMTIGKQGTSIQGNTFSPVQRSIYLKSQAKEFIYIPDRMTKGVSYYKKAVKDMIPFIEAGKRVKVVDMDALLEGTDYKDVNDIGRRAVMDEADRTKVLTFEKAISLII